MKGYEYDSQDNNLITLIRFEVIRWLVNTFYSPLLLLFDIYVVGAELYLPW